MARPRTESDRGELGGLMADSGARIGNGGRLEDVARQTFLTQESDRPHHRTRVVDLMIQASLDDRAVFPSGGLRIASENA